MSRKPSPPSDAVHRKMVRTVAEHGWVVTGVAEDNRCADLNCHSVHKAMDPFLYTVGLTAAGLPELLLEHVPVQTAHAVLNGLARQSMAEELAPGCSYTVAGLPTTFNVTPVPGPEGLTICKWAKVFYGARLRVLRVTFGEDN